MPRSELPFDQQNKDLLLDYDFGYFLHKDFEENNYSQEDIKAIYDTYRQSKKRVGEQIQKTKKQALLYLEGQVRLMFTGGLLPALFRIDGVTKEQSILHFSGYGENWAYFELWQKHRLKERNRKKAWDSIVKGGAVLAYILSFLKIMELAFNNL
ncbi:hypothetical protein [Nafulsella turpanensis]|uniref:hypothetical protein n=1 Tax=Nafulsella turpanensis TaxID=1265690 RepID=UPI000347C7C4|nr:hypothetical protein [Nafulsella turpanensis]